MLFLWILQLLIDVLLVGLGVSYVVQKRRLLRLEADLHRSLMDLKESRSASLGAGVTAQSAPLLNTPLGSATSTLSERVNTQQQDRNAGIHSSSSTSLSVTARYTLAQKLITDGVGLSEVARKSGISETELSLLRKFTQAPKKNYEAH